MTEAPNPMTNREHDTRLLGELQGSSREPSHTGGVKLELGGLLARVAVGCRRVFERRWGPLPTPVCWRCDDRYRIEVYDISDEYAVPCPICHPHAFGLAARRRGWSTFAIVESLAGDDPYARRLKALLTQPSQTGESGEGKGEGLGASRELSPGGQRQDGGREP